MKGYRFAKMPLLLDRVRRDPLRRRGVLSPDDDERALVSLPGFVLDADNDPIAGAQVRVIDQAPGATIGTRNYSARGSLRDQRSWAVPIEGVQLSPGDQVVLNLEPPTRTISLASLPVWRR